MASSEFSALVLTVPEMETLPRPATCPLPVMTVWSGHDKNGRAPVYALTGGPRMVV